VDFHRSLVEASGIEPLVAFNDLLQVFFKRFESNISASANRYSGVESHTRIVNALRDGQLEIAEQELRKHLSYNILD
jgi:DNA-binding FadR family transcriptional regulator